MKHCALPYADWGIPEFYAALSASIGGRIRRGPAIEELEERLARLLGVAHTFAVNSGRTALGIGLQGLAELRPGRTEVIIPAYICPAVVDAVRQSGLRPVAAPVGPDLNIDAQSVRRLIGNATLAIVVAHMYGCPADIGVLEDLARQCGVFLVDDAAQVVGETVDGRSLGTFGDFGVVSFAQSKCIVSGASGAGGVLLCQNPRLLPIVRSTMRALAPAHSRGAAFLAFVWNYLLAAQTSRATYYWRRLVPAPARDIVPARIANLDALIALCQIDSRIDRRKQRIGLLDRYARQLCGNDPGIGFPQYAPGRYLSRVMLLLPEAGDLALCRRQLRLRAMETRQAYPVAWANPDPDSYTRQLSERLIEVPAGIAMSANDVKSVCDFLVDILMNRNAPASIRRHS